MHFLISVVAVITARQPLIEGIALIQSFLFFSCICRSVFIFVVTCCQGFGTTQRLMKSGFKTPEKTSLTQPDDVVYEKPEEQLPAELFYSTNQHSIGSIIKSFPNCPLPKASLNTQKRKAQLLQLLVFAAVKNKL